LIVSVADRSRESWCLPKARAASPQENANILRAKGLLPTFAVVMVEKYGVGPHDKPKDPFGNCSAAFYALTTPSANA